ncbi:MAG: ATP-binding cassette domain-containing protein [Rhodocyclaceae bacterium]|nr:ATP-binding cassette domain-containing protein [Rhodocyclaceae bacterium]
MEALRVISDDHRALWRLTTALDALNADMRRHGASTSLATMNQMLDYVETYVDKVHHPKEDQFLFPKVMLRRPDVIPAIKKLQIQHEEGPRYLASIRRKGEDIQAGRDTNEQAFFADIDRFITLLRDHIHVEERDVMTAARDSLTAEDWLEIDAPFLSNDDPLFGKNARAEFAELRSRLVLMAPEPVGLGGGYEATASDAALLSIRGLTSHYGRIQALAGIDIEIRPGQLVALVGANGAGKTTLLRTVSGVQPASGGSIIFAGRDITRMAPHQRVKLGICQSPEGRQVFGPLSIEDNLRLGAFTRPKDETADDMEAMYQLFPILKEKRNLPAGTLSGGQQQMLAMARALMGRPKLLLLDEPSMGLAPLLVDEIFRVVESLKAKGMTIFLVEQNAHAALSIADVGYVIEAGRTLLSGPGPELLKNDDVKRAYLGI